METRLNRRPPIAAVALVLLLGHVVALASMSPGHLAAVVSDFFQLAAAGLTAFACFYTSRRSAGYPASFWFVIGSSFIVWAAGQTGQTYISLTRQDFSASPIQLVLPFFLSFSIMFLAVFRSHVGSTRNVDWTWVLDALQVTVLIVAVYLFLVYVPTLQYGQQALAPLRLHLLRWRNIALVVGLTVRALWARNPSDRRLFGPVAMAMAVYSVSSWLGNQARVLSQSGSGHWYDLAWTVPFTMVTIAAARWRDRDQDHDAYPQPLRMTAVVLVYLPSLVLPVLMLAMYAQVVREQVVVGLTALMISIVLYALRLGVMHRQQQQTLEALRISERTMRESEQKFERAFQASPDCVAITDLQSGHVLEINGRFEQLTGYSRSDILGKTGFALGLFADPDFESKLLIRFRESGAVRDFEYELRRKSGEVASVMVSAVPIEIGGRPCAFSVHRDITSQKLAEEALHKSEARFRELVENANDIIFTVDRDGLCLSMNPMGEKITGYVREDPRGISFQEMVVPEQAETAWRQLERVLNGEAISPFDIDVISKAGKRITLELAARPIYEEGVAVGAQGIARDITARRELEAQLRQAQKMEAVGSLAAGVAHDFNNLLTVILGNCEASAPEVQRNDPLREAFQEIQAAAQRAASLTSQLLAFSRRQVVQTRILNLNKVISTTQRMLTRLIGEDVVLDFFPSDALGWIEADEGQIHQIVVNLAVNARDAMPRGGHLLLETQNVSLTDSATRVHPQMPLGDYVLLAVSDTGTGMDDATRARIFEPFFTTKEVGRGTGLGLATVYGIVKQNQGFIWVESQPGQGTRFELYFRRAQAPVSEQLAMPSAREHHATGRETIVLVEDEKPLLELLSRHLKRGGYTVTSAGNGREAIDACRRLASSPDLLITDVVMPGMSGRVLAEGLRGMFPALKVLYLSGYSDEELLRHGVLPSGTYFLQKPFSLRDLTKKVRDIVDGQ